MKLSIQSDEGGLVRVECEGSITMTQVQQGMAPIEQLLGKDAFSKHVLFDLTKTNYIDSSGVSWMLVCHQQFHDHNGRIVFHSAPKTVRQTLDLLRMDLVLYLATDENEAKVLVQEERR